MKERKSRPRRTCVGCRKSREREHLLRVVCSPEGMLVPDFKAVLPGRGAYLCYRPECLRAAVRRKALSHALKRPVPAVELQTLEARILEGLDARILSMMGLMSKAGKVAAGRESIRKVLGAGGVHLLVHAADTEDFRDSGPSGPPRVRVHFSREDLGRAVGKAPRPVLGILDVKAGEAIRRMIERRNRLASSGGESFYGEAESS